MVAKYSQFPFARARKPSGRLPIATALEHVERSDYADLSRVIDYALPAWAKDYLAAMESALGKA